MHYKNGREAKVGDRVVVLNQGKPFAGVLIETTPGSTSCNGQVVAAPGNSNYVTLSDCIHADDVQAKPAAS